MRILTPVLTIAVLAGLAWCYIFGPYYVDDYRMQDVVGTTALTWAAYDETRAHHELVAQLRDREIPEYLTPESCSFYEDVGEVKVVDCQWMVDVYIPYTDVVRRLSFRRVKSASKDGRLID